MSLSFIIIRKKHIINWETKTKLKCKILKLLSSSSSSDDNNESETHNKYQHNIAQDVVGHCTPHGLWKND